ncbi:MAG: D-alanyl-D-alanine carboxypeptidase [Oscillospiraceae bacterium]|nr:D-alanyl-D-alanine carboxypeptidase [Oscillospiraceae bacterium]
MRKNTKRIISVVIILSLFNIAGFAVSAAAGVNVYINTEGLENPPDITADAAVIMDAVTGDIVYEKNAGKIIYPASTVKIMTAIIVLENVSDFDGQVSISRQVVQNTIGNTLDPRVSEGEVFSVEDLLYALLLRGANDAALALAEHTSGTVAAFVAKMNEKALELGCANTVFTNPTGMHSPDMTTTVTDMSKIVFYASKIQKFMDIASSARYAIEPTNRTRGERILHNRNHFISKGQFTQYYYEYARGINYGSTTEAGLCLTTLAEQSGLSYLGIVMGSPQTPIPGTDNVRLNCFPDMQSLFDWVFSLYSYRTIIDRASVIQTVGVKLSANRDEITLAPDGEISVLMPKNADEDEVIVLQTEIFEELLVAPVTKGDVMGRVTVLYNGEVAGSVNLISNADVELSGVLNILDQIRDMVSGVWFRASVIIFMVLFAFYISVTLLRKSRSKQRRFY